MYKFISMWCLLLLICAIQVSGKSVGDILSFCKIDDTNRDECLKSAIQDAIKKIAEGGVDDVFSIEPVVFPSAEIGKGTGPVNVIQKYKPLKLHNFGKNSVVKNVKFNIESNKFKLALDLFNPLIIMDGEYNFNGKILLLPVVGDGHFEIKLYDVSLSTVIEGDTYEKNGKTYAQVKNVEATLNPEKVDYRFENLFNGDEKLSAQIHNILRDNSLEVYQDVKSGYQKLAGTYIKATTNKIFEQIEFGKLFGIA